MEAQQCVELTGTNCSFGLIALITQCPLRRAKRAVGPKRSLAGLVGGDPNGPRARPLDEERPPRRDGVLRIKSANRAGSCSAASLMLLSSLFFAGLVALAGSPNPFPSRTRPLNSPAPMVLCLKARESRSPPGPPRTAEARHRALGSRPRACSLWRAWLAPRAPPHDAPTPGSQTPRRQTPRPEHLAASANPKAALPCGRAPRALLSSLFSLAARKQKAAAPHPGRRLFASETARNTAPPSR